MKRSVAAVVVALAPLCAGGLCGGTGSPTPDEEQDCVTADLPASGQTTVLFGHPEPVFRPIGAGDRLPMFFGPQGGQHFFLTLRVFTPREAADHWFYSVRFDPDGPPPESEPPSRVGDLDACVGRWSEIQNFLVSVDQADRTGGVVHVELELYDKSGRVVSMTKTSTHVEVLPP